MSLQDRLDAFKAAFESGNPPYNVPRAVVDVFHRATAELVASGLAQNALKAGDAAPAFILDDADGMPVSSADLLARGPMVLTFYRGVWCPYCNLDLEALQAALPEIAERGASLVAISPQSTPNSRKVVRQHKLTFPVLSDPRADIAAAFGLKFKLSDELVATYKQLGVDLPAYNEDPSWTLPMPARYVIGQDGIIVYAEVNPDYTQRPDPSELIPVLDHLVALKNAA